MCAKFHGSEYKFVSMYPLYGNFFCLFFKWETYRYILHIVFPITEEVFFHQYVCINPFYGFLLGMRHLSEWP